MGHKIKVYTDHKNLVFTTFNTERVLRWRMVLEEYGPELIYIKGGDNVVADALSRLDLIPEDEDQDSDKVQPTRKETRTRNKNSTKNENTPRIPPAKEKKDRANDINLLDFYNVKRDELPDNVYPLRISLISAEQKKDERSNNKIAPSHVPKFVGAERAMMSFEKMEK